MTRRIARNLAALLGLALLGVAIYGAAEQLAAAVR